MASLVAGQCGPYRYARAGCAACMDQACCGELEACARSPGCNAQYACRLGCETDDWGCLARCAVLWNRNVEPWFRLHGCRRGCASECGLRCEPWRLLGSDCNACRAEACCEPRARCESNPECREIEWCARDCARNSESCIAECEQAHPSGAEEYRDLRACTGTHCVAPCEQPDWSCLSGPIAWLQPAEATTARYREHLVDFVAGTPWVGLEVTACRGEDPACQQPLAKSATSDDGVLEIDLPVFSYGFDGYLEYSGVDAYPALHYRLPPIIEDTDFGALRWPKETDVELLASIIGVELDPARGMLAVNPFDCTAALAAGVSVAVDVADGKSRTFYFDGPLPSLAATQTDTENAIGGVGNLPPGAAVVTLTVAATGETIAERLVLIRPQVLTYIGLPPTPKAP